MKNKDKQLGLIKGNENYNNNIDNTNNSTNDSYNTTYNINLNQYNFNPEIDSIKNSNNRTLLKSLVGKPITIWAYAIDEYSRIKSNQLIRYTIINVHNQNHYIADHIQLQIPYEIYDENIRHKIIKVIGNVYEYEDKKTKEMKQSITAERVIISNANDMYIANPDTIRVKGVEFEYACIQNKSLEIDGEYGESDYDVFMHIVDDDTVYLLFADDINNSTALSRKLTKYKRLMTPKDFE